jgi:malate synthase
MPDEPPKKTSGPHRSESPAANTDPGRLAEDDRGNITWQWANNDALQADDTLGGIERMRALVDPRLDVVDDEAPTSLRDNTKGLKTGYNPYDSGKLGKVERKKKKSLAELSQWIEARRKAEDAGEPSE